ncbi:MAG: aminotransferase class III-fold pyridoxal phosphate-dependent enzyme, partial [Chloroflexota bacterium]
PGCFHIEAPWLYRNPFTDDPVKLGQVCAEMLDREITHQGPDTVAAFIAEPVQGAGGVIVPPENYWPLIREVCDKHGVLLISDEVVTGFGRTGTMFGARTWGVAPDMMTMAKGINSGYIPLGATSINERMADAFLNNDNEFGRIMHGYTYSGHPIACAAGLATIDIIEQENIPTNAGKQGDYFLERLLPFKERFKSVGDVRGKGLMVGIEMVADKKTKEPKDPAFGIQVAEVAKAEGAMVRAAGNKIILSPPLVIEEEELDVIVNALDIAFSELDK